MGTGGRMVKASQGRIQVWTDLALPPPFLTTKSCKFSLFWGRISQFSLNFDTQPPLFANPGSDPASAMYAEGRGFESHAGIFPDFFCRGICCAGVDLCCLSLIITLRVGMLFLLSCASIPFPYRIYNSVFKTL